MNFRKAPGLSSRTLRGHLVPSLACSCGESWGARRGEDFYVTHTTKPRGYQPSLLSITTPLPAGDNGQQCSAKTLTKSPSQGHPRRDTRGTGAHSFSMTKGFIALFLVSQFLSLQLYKRTWKCCCFNHKWSVRTWTWEKFFQKTKMNGRRKIKSFSNLTTCTDPYNILEAYSFVFICFFLEKFMLGNLGISFGGPKPSS